MNVTIVENSVTSVFRVCPKLSLPVINSSVQDHHDKFEMPFPCSVLL